MPSAAAVAASVTGAAAVALSADGLFPEADTASQTKYPELNRVQANRLAVAWVNQFALLHRSFLTRTRGGSIDFSKLAPCGRSLYAESPFLPPGEDWPVTARRLYGPWWLITLCADGRPEVSLAISAWATDLTIVDGRIVFPQSSGNEFVAIGIPVASQGEFPMSPESAVTLVARATGRKVGIVPRLFAVIPRDGLPQSARWQTVITPPAHYTGSKTGARTATDVFVGSRDIYPRTEPRQWLALPQQHASYLVDVYPVPNPGETEPAYRARSAHPDQKPVLLKQGYVFEYEEASAVAQK